MPEGDAHQIGSIWLWEYFQCFDKSPEEEDVVILILGNRINKLLYLLTDII